MDQQFEYNARWLWCWCTVATQRLIAVSSFGGWVGGEFGVGGRGEGDFDGHCSAGGHVQGLYTLNAPSC